MVLEVMLNEGKESQPAAFPCPEILLTLTMTKNLNCDAASYHGR